MWQKCPICNGTGKEFQVIKTNLKNCTTCNGTKIISELNGLPPNFEQNKIERQKSNIPNQVNNILKQYLLTQKECYPKPPPMLNTDFRDGNMETQQEYFGK